MEDLLGLLTVCIKRGVNLAIRDTKSSDPYVIVRLGKQKLKTRVVNNNLNPEWSVDLILSITDELHSYGVGLWIENAKTFPGCEKGDGAFKISSK